jgi:hypothetical protein
MDGSLDGARMSRAAPPNREHGRAALPWHHRFRKSACREQDFCRHRCLGKLRQAREPGKSTWLLTFIHTNNGRENGHDSSFQSRHAIPEAV